MLPQDQCVCYQETLARARQSRINLLVAVLGIVTALIIWAVFLR